MTNFDDWLEEVCYMLSQYGGRDKVIRTLCYAAKLAATMSSNPDTAKKLSVFGSKMSQTRATLRLFDDLPMLQATLSYGLGKSEPDKAVSFIGVLANVIDTLYYPIDKTCWLVEHKLLNVKHPGLWDTLSSLFWMISVYLSLMRTLRLRMLRENHIEKCLKGDTIALEKFKAKDFIEQVTIFRNCLDIMHAGSTLPKGFLWGGKLQPWQVALIGTISSVLGMYQFLAKRRLAKS